MASTGEPLLKERVNLRTISAAGLLLIFGALLLLATHNKEIWGNHETLRDCVHELGVLLFVTCILTLVWDFVGKRAFADEILAKARISQELAASGIIQVTDSFQRPDIDWTRLFKDVSQLDIFVAYAQTWRNQHRHEFEALAKRRGARIRVVLPDPDHPETVLELARRFSYTQEQTVEKIREAISYFESLCPLPDQDGAEVEVWLLQTPPLFSCYRFDNKAVFAVYTQQRKRASVPTIVCEKGGILYQFIENEFRAMMSNGGTAKRWK